MITDPDTPVDFAEYRLRMRAGVPPAGRSFYLAGLTRGVRRGARSVDRAQRLRLADAIRARHPQAVVHDPVETWYGPDGDTGFADFHRLTDLAASSEVCVALLPDRESVADALAEVQVARRGGRTVVAITSEPDDFVVRAFASVVLPDLTAFDSWINAA